MRSAKEALEISGRVVCHQATTRQPNSFAQHETKELGKSVAASVSSEILRGLPEQGDKREGLCRWGTQKENGAGQWCAGKVTPRAALIDAMPH